MPDTKPANSGAPDASATPRHSGKATSATTIEAGTSARQLAKNDSPLLSAVIGFFLPNLIEDNFTREGDAPPLLAWLEARLIRQKLQNKDTIFETPVNPCPLERAPFLHRANLQ